MYILTIYCKSKYEVSSGQLEQNRAATLDDFLKGLRYL